MQQWIAENPDVVLKLAVAVLAVLGALGLSVPVVIKYIRILLDLLTNLADKVEVAKNVDSTPLTVIDNMERATKAMPPSREEAMTSVLDIVKDRDRKSRVKKIGLLAYRTFAGIISRKRG